MMAIHDGLYTVADGFVFKGAGRKRDVRARWTGEKRPPLAGEWYLSGAIVEAYRAPSDLHTVYHIAELVMTYEKRERGVTRVLDEKE